MLREESLCGSGANGINLELRLLVASLTITLAFLNHRLLSLSSHRLTPDIRLVHSIRTANHAAAKLRRQRLVQIRRLAHISRPLLCLSLFALLLQETCLFFKQVSNILQETLFVMEDVILVLNKRNTKYVEDPLRTGQSLATKRVLRESLDQMVSDLGINEVLLSPLQVNKLLL